MPLKHPKPHSVGDNEQMTSRCSLLFLALKSRLPTTRHGRYLFILTIYFLIGFLGMSSGFCQGEANIWYFGDSAGLDFSNGSPVSLSGSKITTLEGSATISDANGNLLMYTDGSKVWDANHNIMPSGNGLKGSFNSSQSAIFLPRPGPLNSRYYVFTVDNNNGPDGLRYSEVDMALNGGMGDVLGATKNTPLFSPASEKLAAVRHANNVDFWVLAQDGNNADFLAYLVTSSGVSSIPVVSSLLPSTPTPIGYMKFSKCGTKVAAAFTWKDSIQVFDFDNSTGVLSNPLAWESSFYDPYGVEFSPNGKLLYVSSWAGYQGVYQYDLLAGSSSAIAASEIKLSPSDTANYGALQLAPDGKIYIAKHFWPMGTALAAIHNPDVLGMGANFDNAAVPILSGKSSFGLPSFVQSWILCVGEIVADDLCLGETTTFTFTDTVGIDSVHWNFGDPASGVLNNGTGLSVFHEFTSAGQYTITANMYAQNGTMSIFTDTVTLHPSPVIELVMDTTFCAGDSLAITTNNLQPLTYVWQDNSTGASQTVNTSGQYWVEATDSNGCMASDSMYVTATPLPLSTLGADTGICPGSTLILNASQPGGSYTWSTGSNDGQITLTAPDVVWVEVTVNNCSVRDSIVVAQYTLPIIDLGVDTLLCPGDIYTLNASQPDFSQYRWHNGSTSNTFAIQAPGTYWVQVKNLHCYNSDTMAATYWVLPEINLGNDTVLCIGESLVLDATVDAPLSFTWQDGSMQSVLFVEERGWYSVEADHFCGVLSDSILVDHCNCSVYVPNAFTPNNDEHNPQFRVYSECDFTVYKLRIFDRWGKRLFISEDPKEGWTGAVKGTIVPAGVYTWTLYYETNFLGRGFSEELSGRVTIVR